MSRPVRVVIGAVLFNGEKHVREAIESLLAQTHPDFALLLVDDCSTDATLQIAQEYSALDPRIRVERNATRLGLVGNSRRAFELARELYPQAEYFAWASDHDLWHPRWLEQLVGALDANPQVVLAYPKNRRVGPSGEVLARKPWSFDTFGVTNRWQRVRRSVVHMSAGNMVYGLCRVGALQRAGVYRHVLVPDRLLFAELSLYGEFKQVPYVLWFRRWHGRVFSLGRQRRSFFPGGRPLYAYVPWWISHAASLFWTLTVRGTGQPEVSRAAGIAVALQVFALATFMHAWQILRECRGWVVERRLAMRPYYQHVRLLLRAIHRQGIKDWTRAHLHEYRKRGRKARARLRASLDRGAFEAVRRPGLSTLRLVRRIPLVRDRIVPSLLNSEVAQIPAAPSADAMKKALERLQRTDGPILIGPWVGEVGFELLYWIPFLNWAVKTYGLDRRRLIAVSRGGARRWYQHLTSEYVDVFELMSVPEYHAANEARWDTAGHQKQYELDAMDQDLAQRARTKLGFAQAELLHPSLMYQLLRFYWFEKAGVGLLTHHTDYRPIEPVVRSARLESLPRDYVAVRFYFRPSFPDTPENRRFAADTIRSISREVPVVLLNTGLRLDDHEDAAGEPAADSMGVYRVEQLMTPEHNLDVQTEIVAGARAFVGTYGGLSYLAPLMGVPSMSFYSTEAKLVPAHLDAGWRLARRMGVPCAVLGTDAAWMLSTMFAKVAEEQPVPLARRAGV